jgi:hypothetical protein
MYKKKQQPIKKEAASNGAKLTLPSCNLVDEVLERILGLLPSKTRAKIGEVSKQWFKVSRKPSLWTSFEMAFPTRMNAVRGQKKKDINSTAHLGSLAAFLHKRCPNLEDLHLSYDFHANMSASRLDAFFQIKSLKRMNVAELAGFHDTEYAPAQIPACKSLEVLNFNLYFNVESLKKLLQGLPNLKELYVPNARVDFLNHKNAFSLAKKLERLALKFYSMPADLLVKTCPSLRYIMYYRCIYGRDSDSEGEEFKPIEVIGKTVALRPDAFAHRSLAENYKLLAPVLVPYLQNYPHVPTLAALATNYFGNRTLIKYLVTEMRFDLNYLCPEYTYRQSFVNHFNYYSDRKIYFPMDAAMAGWHRDVEAVKELIALGARPECPKEGMSYFEKAKRADVKLLLLQLGADPNKMVDVDLKNRKSMYHLIHTFAKVESIPAFTLHFIDPTFEDSAQFVLALKGKVDFNTRVHCSSMLEWAIDNKKWHSVLALAKLGVKPNSDAMNLSSFVTNGMLDEAKIMKAQAAEKAEEDAQLRERELINERLRQAMMKENSKPPKIFHVDSSDSESDDPFFHSHSSSGEYDRPTSYEENSSEDLVEESFEEVVKEIKPVVAKLPEKLKRLYDALVGIWKIIQDLESFSVKAFQKQLKSDIFPAYISNSKRRQQFKSMTDEATSKELFKALLRTWIENFSTEFHHEIESLASK